MYDLIGDIHGHADELVQLLELLGYEKAQGTYRHPERKLIFLGDFIDRGPKIRLVLEIVRPMVEASHALAVMGNHELNALAYHTEDQDSPGEHLRRRNPKNEKQHKATLDQLPSQELRSHLEWFRTLPMWLDLDGLRVVHACWDGKAMGEVSAAHKDHGGMTTEFLHSACRKRKLTCNPDVTLAQVRRALAHEYGLLLTEVSTKLRQFEKERLAAFGGKLILQTQISTV
jgi:hypothetical protein